jgi:ubiquinone/menaquinone biosynthesis C-methylase UbiE
MSVRRPRIIAEQARNARGALGHLIAFIMARETWSQNLQAIDALHVQPADHILDIGCGPGRALTKLAAEAPRGRAAGADPSELMVEIARDRNRKLLRAGRADIAVASAEALPFPDASFDKVLCVHVIYFWSNLEAALREIRRVLKPGGRLVMLFRTSADTASVHSFPADVYRFRSTEDVEATARLAGLIVAGDPAGSEPALVVATRPLRG